MSSERYDETVREQKKAERKRQIKIQIAVIAAVLLCIIAGIVILVNSRGKAKAKEDNAALVKAVAASYQTFREANGFEESAEELKKETTAFANWLLDTYPEASEETLLSKSKAGELAEKDFYDSYGKTLHVLSDEYKGYLKDENTAAENHIYLRDGENEKQADITIAGDLCLTEGGYALNQIDQSGELSQSISSEIIQQMQDADVLYLNQEFSIGSQGGPLDGKTEVYHASSERMGILEEIGTDLVSLANDHAADYGLEGLSESLGLLKDAGIAYVGAGNNSEEAKQPVYFIVNGIKIGFTAASNLEDGFDTAAGEESAGVFKISDTTEYKQQIENAAKECDYLIVYIHNETDDTNAYEQYQHDQGAEFLQAGADIVIGGHSNRLQGIEYVDGKPIVYSMGELLPDGITKYAGLLKLNITVDGLEKMSFVPCLQSENTTEYLSDSEEQQKMYEAFSALCPNASIDENGVITEIAENENNS